MWFVYNITFFLLLSQCWMLSSFHCWLALVYLQLSDFYPVWLAIVVPVGVVRRKFKKLGESAGALCLWKWTEEERWMALFWGQRDFGRARFTQISVWWTNRTIWPCSGSGAAFSTNVSHWEHMLCLSAFSSFSNGTFYWDSYFKGKLFHRLLNKIHYQKLWFTNKNETLFLFNRRVELKLFA